MSCLIRNELLHLTTSWALQWIQATSPPCPKLLRLVYLWTNPCVSQHKHLLVHLGSYSISKTKQGPFNGELFLARLDYESFWIRWNPINRLHQEILEKIMCLNGKVTISDRELIKKLRVAWTLKTIPISDRRKRKPATKTGGGASPDGGLLS